MKRLTIKAISLVLLLAFFANAACYGLATLPASQNPIAKREILAALQRTQIRYAESEDAIRLLNANNAECLLLSSGKYLVTKRVANNDLKLLRAIIHEDVEAIMQILAKEDKYKYQGIKELILKHFPPSENNNLPIGLYVNHNVARAFEWLILIEQGVILKDEIPDEAKAYIKVIEPIIKANKHNYFTSEFWNSSERGQKISLALNNGMRFYQVATVQEKNFFSLFSDLEKKNKYELINMVSQETSSQRSDDIEYLGIFYANTVSKSQDAMVCEKIKHAGKGVFFIPFDLKDLQLTLTEDMINALCARDEIARILIIPPVSEKLEDVLLSIGEQINRLSKGKYQFKHCFDGIIFQAPNNGLVKLDTLRLGNRNIPLNVCKSKKEIASLAQKINIEISTSEMIDTESAKLGELEINIPNIELMLEEIFLKRLRLGRKSRRLDDLDPEGKYQPLKDFPTIAGPSFEELVSNLPSKIYDLEVPNNDYSPTAISGIIWTFFNSRADEIRHSGSKPVYGENEEKYIKQITECVKLGMPVELIFMNFSPKFASPLISGYDLSPDLSNLLALQHLIDVSKSVQKIYPPGIKFIILYEGRLFQELGQFTDQEIQKCFEQVKYFAKVLEEKSGTGEVIEIVDAHQLVKGLGPQFMGELEEEEKRLDRAYESDENNPIKQEMEFWRTEFAMNILDLNRLLKEHGEEHSDIGLKDWLRIINRAPPSVELLNNKFLQHIKDYAVQKTRNAAVDYFAFRNIKYSAGSAKTGILTNYPHAIPITVLADHLRLALQLIPGVSSYPHHGITVWTGKKWDIAGLMDLARYPGRFAGVTLSGKNDVGRKPFYYILKGADCPAFARSVEPQYGKGLFPDVLTKKGFRLLEDWSNRGAMDSMLFLAEDKSGKKVLIKYSTTEGFAGSGRPVLRKEAERLKNISEKMGKLSGCIFPEILDYIDDQAVTYYVMNYFPDTKTVDDYLADLPKGNSYISEAKRTVSKLLNIMAEKIYSKGSEATPPDYISRYHLDRLREGVRLLTDNSSDVFKDFLKDREFEIDGREYKDITEFFRSVFSSRTVTVNGIEFLNFPALLEIIAEHEEKINKDLNPARIPIITHGDLHLKNVLINSKDELFLIDPYGKRPINAVETELGRIMLSFFADFLRKGNYDMSMQYLKDGKPDFSLFYNGDKIDSILDRAKARDAMLETYRDHPEIYSWIKDTKNWEAHVRLIEAIHIFAVAASKFNSTEPPGKLTVACYITGIVLMNKVLADMGLIDQKYGNISSSMRLFIPGEFGFQKEQFMQGMALNADKMHTNKALDFIIESLEKIEKRDQDKDAYLHLWEIYEANVGDSIITDFYILDMETYKAIILTLENGKKIAARLVKGNFVDSVSPSSVLYLKPGVRLELVSADEILRKWREINFPDATYAPALFEDYSERKIFESYVNKKTITIGRKQYQIIDFLGLGKEAKVFRGVDVEAGTEVALKFSLVNLEGEFSSAKAIATKLESTPYAKYLPSYESFDKEKNIVVMELIKGACLDEYILQRLKDGESLEKILLFFSNIIVDICSLKEKYDVLCGQFNFRNIIVDETGSVRLIDPSYPLPRDRYDLSQIIRIGATMMERFYKLRDNDYPAKVKSANSLGELENIAVSDPVLARFEELNLAIRPLINRKVKEIIKKCLIPSNRFKTLRSLRSDFEELRNLIYAYHSDLAPATVGINAIDPENRLRLRKYVDSTYKALAIDYNNTLEQGEIPDRYLMQKVAGLLNSGIHVAVITGKRASWINTFVKAIEPFLSDKYALNCLHFYTSEGAIGCNIGTRALYYEHEFDRNLMASVTKAIKREYPSMDFKLHCRTDGYRMNFDPMMDVTRLNELFRELKLPVAAIASGIAIDIVPVNINKGTALADFASRLGINTNDIAKIGDQGQEYGNDNNLLSGLGSFSVDKYKVDSDQVSIVEALGLKGIFATGWLLDNLKISKPVASSETAMRIDTAKDEQKEPQTEWIAPKEIMVNAEVAKNFIDSLSNDEEPYYIRSVAFKVSSKKRTGDSSVIIDVCRIDDESTQVRVEITFNEKSGTLTIQAQAANDKRVAEKISKAVDNSLTESIINYIKGCREEEGLIDLLRTTTITKENMSWISYNIFQKVKELGLLHSYDDIAPSEIESAPIPRDMDAAIGLLKYLIERAPPSLDEHLKNRWDDVYAKDTFKNRIVEQSELSQEVLNKWLAGERDKSILSLGCGRGFDELFFAEHGHRVTGLDLSKVALSKLMDDAKKRGLADRLNVVWADMSKPLPLEDSSIDLVYSYSSLIYFDDAAMKRIVDQIHRVLKVNGTVAVAARSTKDLHYEKGKPVGRPEENMFIGPGGHLRRFFTKEAMAGYFKDFEILELTEEGSNISNVYGEPHHYVKLIAKKIKTKTDADVRSIKNEIISDLYDSQSTTVLLTDLLYASLREDRIYEIRYDTSRLTTSQIEIIEEYVRLLQLRSSNPDSIKLRPFSSAQGSKESLIAVYCTGKNFKGEGHVDVAIPDGELKEYLLRIAGMVNIALASSNIPDNLTREEVDKYRPIMSYIKNQYKAILGEELAIPDSPEDILKVIRRIILGLPKSMRMNTGQIEEFNRLAKQALTAA